MEKKKTSKNDQILKIIHKMLKYFSRIFLLQNLNKCYTSRFKTQTTLQVLFLNFSQSQQKAINKDVNCRDELFC